eukprot:CAMPEP_0117676702 /NCGR_PEP_ID=MMETSP0804-20121206/16338_1 /TAXON_ID=1074897 /ORGANISM="Tetraselmis astigmatica, Strain CCMP880" /LENGTH=356 /DNA_ID=CAMNT_0005485907 /DNA_START=389 /DNA_END=1456 /DNA_ORIENTATION=-
MGERGGAVRVRDAHGRELNFGSWGEDPPRGQSKGGKGKGKNKASYVPGSDVYRCACCVKECSGEVSFSQHCQGRAHALKAGFYGFAGLTPNAHGVTPKLSETFLRQNQPREMNDGPAAPTLASKGKEPAVQKVSMSVQNEEAVRAALHRSASAGSLAKSDDGRPVYQPSIGPAMHKCLSESRLAAGGGSGHHDPSSYPPFWCHACDMDMGNKKALAQHQQSRKHRSMAASKARREGRGYPQAGGGYFGGGPGQPLPAAPPPPPKRDVLRAGQTMIMASGEQLMQMQQQQQPYMMDPSAYGQQQQPYLAMPLQHYTLNPGTMGTGQPGPVSPAQLAMMGMAGMSLGGGPPHLPPQVP